MIKSTFWKVKLNPEMLSSQWFSMIIKTKPKPFGNRRDSNTGNTNDNHEYQFQTPRKLSKMKKVDTNKDFSSPKCFQILQDDINENDHGLNKNDPIDNNSGSTKNKEKLKSNRNTKTKAPTTVILGDSILKNAYWNTISKATKFKKHVIVKYFSGAKVDNMKHYMKPTQEKSPAQIIFHVGTNDLVTNKDSNEIANEIVQLAKCAKTDNNKVDLPLQHHSSSSYQRKRSTLKQLWW